METILVKIEQFVSVNYQSVIYLLLVIGGICLLSLYYLRWRDYYLPYRMTKKSKADGQQSQPKLSVVVPSNNQAELLAARLPQLLEQDYPDFEIIVIDEASTDETRELVEHLQLRSRNLRYTFVPASATDICRRKLAITLGIRAARSEWVVVTTPSAQPVSDQWLSRLASGISDHADVVVGYANYEDDGSRYAKRAIYERLHVLLRCFRSAEGYGGIGGDECNFCVRKSAFLDHKGYADNLKISYGESHLLIDSLSTALNVSVVVDSAAKVTEDLPPYEVWKNIRYCYREILRNSSRCAHYYLWREGLSTMFLYLFLVVELFYLGFRYLQIQLYHDFSTYSFLGDGVMFLFLLVYIFLPIWMLRKTTKVLGERTFGMSLIGYLFLQPFVNWLLKIKSKRYCNVRS